MNRWWLWALPLGWALYTFGPLLAALGAGAVADAHGCTLNEGNAHPCVIAGHDWGGTLYGLFVLGWLALLTLPTGLLAGLVGVVVLAVRRAQRRKTR